MEEMKTCSTCGNDYPVNTYHYANKAKGIRKTVCKDCSYKKAQAFIEKDPVAHYHYMKRHYRENPQMYPGNHYNKKIPAKTGVYIIECLLTDDSYIGTTTNLRHRKYVHFRGVGGGKNKKLTKLIKEYGEAAFNFRVLCECSKEEMWEKETYYCEKYQPNLNIYKVKKNK